MLFFANGVIYELVNYYTQAFSFPVTYADLISIEVSTLQGFRCGYNRP